MADKMNISVVIPLYNKRDSVRRAIQSVLNQTFKPLEIIVVDDGSTDDSAHVVRSLGIKNLRLIHQDNAGVSSARNTGIKSAEGEWIAFLDADDEWMCDYVQSIVMLHGDFPECMVYATAYVYKDGKNEMLPSIAVPEKKGCMQSYFKVASSGSPPLWTSAVTVNKKALLNIGCFSDKIKIGEDLLVWAKLAYQYDIAYLNEPKAVYYFPLNVNVDSKLRFPDDYDLVYRELNDMYVGEKRYEYKKYIRKYIGYWCKIRLHLYSFYGMRDKAFKEYLKMFKATPLNIKGFALLVLAVSPKLIHDYMFNSYMNKMK
ncbi:MAG: glycosyltransferase family 2 protein [Chlorobiaceae bacterium]|nr:glycosyltransferase family 2 protein [Chlorobiaceae bacterium]